MAVCYEIHIKHKYPVRTAQ